MTGMPRTSPIYFLLILLLGLATSGCGFPSLLDEIESTGDDLFGGTPGGSPGGSPGGDLGDSSGEPTGGGSSDGVDDGSSDGCEALELNLIMEQSVQACPDCSVWFWDMGIPEQRPRLEVRYSNSTGSHNATFHAGSLATHGDLIATRILAESPWSGPGSCATADVACAAEYLHHFSASGDMGGSQSWNGLLYSEMSLIPCDASIDRAELHMHINEDEGLDDSDDSSIVSIYRATKSWDYRSVTGRRYGTNPETGADLSWDSPGGDFGAFVFEVQVQRDLLDRGFNKAAPQAWFDLSDYVSQLQSERASISGSGPGEDGPGEDGPGEDGPGGDGPGGDGPGEDGPGDSTETPGSSGPFVRIVSPSGGDSVTNPVSFVVEAGDVARLKLQSDGWPMVNWTPDASTTTRTYSFSATGMNRVVELIGEDSDGNTVAVDSVTIFVEADTSPSPGTSSSGSLSVPYFYQYDNANQPHATCGNTSAAMVLNFWNPSSVVPDTLTNSYGKNQGQSPSGLAQMYGWQGLHSTYTYSASRNDIRGHIDAGRPVVVHGNWTGSGHIAVIIGYNATGWISNDPAGDWDVCYNCGHGNGVHYSYGGGWDNGLSSDGDIWLSAASSSPF